MADDAPLNLMQRAAEELKALGAQPAPNEASVAADPAVTGAAAPRPAPATPLRRKESQQATIDIKSFANLAPVVWVNIGIMTTVRMMMGPCMCMRRSIHIRIRVSRPTGDILCLRAITLELRR